MYNAKISVIIPVFNAEQFIAKCIQSVIDQTFQDWELLLVDDGSRDDSYSICVSFANRDKRIRVFRQENSGVAAARNMGIKEAKAEYIEFIDADDMLDAEYMTNLYRGVENYSADVCVGNVAIVHMFRDEVISVHRSSIETGCYSLQDYLQQYPYYMTHCLFGTPWNKLYKRNILHRHGLCFNTELKNNEDTHFNYEYFAKCNTVYVSDAPFYNYINREEYLSASKKHIPNLFDIYTSTYIKAIEFLKKTNTLDQHIVFQNTYYINLVIGAMNAIVNGNNGFCRKERIKQLGLICKDEFVRNAVLTVTYTDIKRRAVGFMIKMNQVQFLYYTFRCHNLIVHRSKVARIRQ